jgi:tetratricopeptide (TPR) repeat protein
MFPILPARLTALLFLACTVGIPAIVSSEELDPVTSARSAIETGDRLFSEGRVVPACEHYELAVGIAPEWWYPAYKKALCDMSRGKYKNALYLLSKAASMRSGLYVLHLTMARWHRRVGELDEARSEYEKAIALTKGATEPMLELADTLLAQQRTGEARLVLKRAEYYAPTNLGVRSRLAWVSEELGHYSDAENQLRFLSLRGVNQRRSLALLARFYQRRGAMDLAQLVLHNLARPPADGLVALPPPKADFEGEANHEQ